MSEMSGVKGQKIIYLYRKYADRTSKAGLNVAYVSTNSRSISANNDAINTKDGVFRPGNKPEITISATSYMKDSDTVRADLESAIKTSALLEIWEVNLDAAGTSTGTYKGTYYQGYLSSFEITSTAEEWVEVAMEFAINGVGADGDVTVSQSIVDEASYTFADATQAST